MSVSRRLARMSCPLRALVIMATLAACQKTDKEATPPPAGAPAHEVALTGASVMIGAGDIAVCESNGDEKTAAIVDSVLKVDSGARVETVVFTIGDNAYSVGSTKEFANCFATSWGDRRRAIIKVIRPAPGNHEYYTRGAAPYYSYFGARAGPPGKGYYSYDVGAWHVVSLNSEVAIYPRTSAANAQEDWLRKDLTEHRAVCTLAYFHRPLFSSGDHGSSPTMRRLWEIMYAHGVDLVLNGHDHHYERFLPLTPGGTVDSVRGIEEIVVGTGGGVLRGVRSPRARYSAAAVHGYFGVLKLNLAANQYRHAFLDTNGRIWDEGGRRCH